MKRQIMIWIVIFALLLPFSVNAVAKHVSDQGDLLSESEEVLLESKAKALSEEYGIDVLILTKSSIFGKNTWDVADDFYYSGGLSGNGILLLISMEYRDWEIATYGTVAHRVSNAKTEDLFDQMASNLAQNDFYGAFDIYLDALDHTLFAAFWSEIPDVITPGIVSPGIEEPSFNTTSDDYTENNAMQLAASLGIGAVIAGIVLLVMRSNMNTARAQRGASNYLKSGSYLLRVQRDRYLYSNTTRVRINQNSGSGGGGSRGGGGGARGGSRGKF